MRRFLLLFPLLLLSCSRPSGPFTGIHHLATGESETIDALVQPLLANFRHLNLALVRDNQIVLTRGYGRPWLHRQEVYASVSKPVTAVLVFHLLEQNLIRNLDDPIHAYLPQYEGFTPASASDRPITIRHLLSHQSGIRHLSDMWRDGKLTLAFPPGDGVLYSTQGYGVLGELIESVTGQAYSDGVRTLIGTPVGATSFGAEEHFLAPGGNVLSTVEDMARFAVGVMTHVYVSEAVFQAILAEGGTTNRQGQNCLGWYYSGFGTPDLALFHAGSNGRPRAFLRVEPESGIAVAITGSTRSEDDPVDLEPLVLSLLRVLKSGADLPTSLSRVRVCEGTSHGAEHVAPPQRLEYRKVAGQRRHNPMRQCDNAWGQSEMHGVRTCVHSSFQSVPLRIIRISIRPDGAADVDTVAHRQRSETTVRLLTHHAAACFTGSFCRRFRSSLVVTSVAPARNPHRFAPVASTQDVVLRASMVLSPRPRHGRRIAERSGLTRMALTY